MWDMLIVGLVVLFFALTLAMVEGLERLSGGDR